MNAKIKEQIALMKSGGRPHRVMLITGEPGRGKTFAARAVKRWSMLEKKIWVEIARPYETANPDSLINLFVLEAMGGEDGHTAKEILSLFIRCDLLIIDDLGNERNPPPTFEPGISSLMEQRYELKRPTWVISNFRPDMVRDKYGDRIYSRIYSAAKIIPFTGRDRRSL